MSASGLELRVKTPRPDASTPAAAQRRLVENDVRQIAIEWRRCWRGRLEACASPSSSDAMKHAAAFAVALGMVLTGSPAKGQEVAATFEELRRLIRIDESISVTDSAGATHKGRLASLSASSLQLRQGSGPWTAFTERDVNNVAAGVAIRCGTA